jgi:hypothetical protein
MMHAHVFILYYKNKFEFTIAIRNKKLLFKACFFIAINKWKCFGHLNMNKTDVSCIFKTTFFLQICIRVSEDKKIKKKIYYCVNRK